MVTAQLTAFCICTGRPVCPKDVTPLSEEFLVIFCSVDSDEYKIRRYRALEVTNFWYTPRKRVVKTHGRGCYCAAFTVVSVIGLFKFKQRRECCKNVYDAWCAHDASDSCQSNEDCELRQTKGDSARPLLSICAIVTLLGYLLTVGS